MNHKPSFLLKLFKLKALFYQFLFLCVGVSLQANLNHGPVASSLGGAGVASMSDVQGVFMNPASIANAQMNHLILNLQTQETQGEEAGDWSVLAVDAGRESFIKGGFSYVKREISSNSSRLTKSRWELAGAKYATAGLGIGVSLTKEKTHNLKSHIESVDYNMDIGSIYNFTPSWSVGALIENAFTGKEVRQYRSTSFGFVYRLDNKFRYLVDFSFQDVANPNRKWVSKIGIDLRVSESVSWRFGYQSNDLESRNYYTAGFSWQGPRLGFYYAFQNLTDNSAETAHNVDLRVFF